MTQKIETKTISATGGAVGGAGVVGTLLLWVYGAWVGGVGWDASNVEAALAAVPAPVSAAILALVAGAVTFAAGYSAPHTFRTDLLTPAEEYKPEHEARVQ